ncbi:hypothetical protein PLANPX_2060 [Lacipirellula parvula]|uniref:Uncharacterized protein n=1 Tax=Lacipirellula parvula TaxID=2650471 RepID=A0A5K7X7B8_9BACT|nr:hypothetical protein PLANPX_2060 [Lacipirellula parvula]
MGPSRLINALDGVNRRPHDRQITSEPFFYFALADYSE